MIDDIDSEILRQLQSNARLSNRELGKAVGLSANAAGARLQRLQSRGVISGFHAALNHAELGQSIEASIDVWQNDDRDRVSFEALMIDDDRIIECVHLTGPLDFRLRARVASPEDLNDLLGRLQKEGGVRQTDSRLVLERLSTNEPVQPTRPAELNT